jgi:hypothetical protein
MVCVFYLIIRIQLSLIRFAPPSPRWPSCVHKSPASRSRASSPSSRESADVRASRRGRLPYVDAFLAGEVGVRNCGEIHTPFFLFVLRIFVIPVPEGPWGEELCTTTTHKHTNTNTQPICSGSALCARRGKIKGCARGMCPKGLYSGIFRSGWASGSLWYFGSCVRVLVGGLYELKREYSSTLESCTSAAPRFLPSKRRRRFAREVRPAQPVGEKLKGAQE